MKTYEIKDSLIIPGTANPRFGDLSMSEIENGRRIGGDHGDIVFYGYVIREGCTVLSMPTLKTAIEDLDSDEVLDTAREILDCAFESIGVECVEHN